MTDTPPAEGKALLELSTLAPERPFIVIDDHKYELAVPDDFGIVEIAELERDEREIRAVMEVPDATDPVVVNRVVELLDASVKRVLRAPDAVIAKLLDHQKLAVVEAFTSSVQGKPATPNRATRRSRSTTARSSRRSAPRSAPATG